MNGRTEGLLIYNKVYGIELCDTLYSDLRNLSCAGNSNLIYNIYIFFQIVTTMKRTKRNATKNGKVMNEVATATSKKALVKVEEMPEWITKKTDGLIIDDLHLLIAIGCIIDNNRTIGDGTFYDAKEDGKIVGAMACIEIEVEAGIFGGQLCAIEEELNCSIAVNSTGRESDYVLLLMKW